MKVAIEGCAHGELERIYNTIGTLEQAENIKVDLLICCGDFQATRNKHDLQGMAVPPKYYNMGSFYKYYNGEKLAPIPTIFIGGNHEASAYLQELPYGGWVAPNIYYLGYAGVVTVAGIRIGGLSGIYKGQDYLKGHFEKPPYSENTKRSVYHVRNLEVFRLKQLSGPIDIFISHDWPMRIWNYGDCQQLLKFKPFFRNDIESDNLGSQPCEELLQCLQPQYWFAAHLHCKFAALVDHPDSKKTTRFLALDKCLPKRRFLQLIDIPHDPNLNIEICYDLEWLTVLYLSNHLLSVKGLCNYLPGESSTERYNFTPTTEEKTTVQTKFSNNLVIPLNFTKTTEGYVPEPDKTKLKLQNFPQLRPQMNPQTSLFCARLNLDDPLVLLEAYAPTNEDHENVPSLDNTSASSDSEECSDAYETFIKDTPVKSGLSGLILPPPKFPDEELNTSVENEVASETPSSLNDSVTEKLSFLNYSSPLAKKFKRRNADLYSSND